MIEDEDGEEWGEGTGSPCDKVISFFIGGIAICLLILASYLLTR
jgi:hypothetical protein